MDSGRATGRLLAAAAVAAGASVAVAQPLWQGSVLPGLRRVDEGFADTGPLSTSQRLIQVDMRAPTGFQGVYQFERAVPFGKPETMFMRASGGLMAVFPRSVYVESRAGLVPEVPAGTVYVIGAPGEVRASPRINRSPTAIDMSVAGQPDPAPRAAPPISRPTPPSEALTIWNSERLRQQRVGRMLESLIVRPAK